jgi:hypothetical protein
MQHFMLIYYPGSALPWTRFEPVTQRRCEPRRQALSHLGMPDPARPGEESLWRYFHPTHRKANVEKFPCIPEINPFFAPTSVHTW